MHYIQAIKFQHNNMISRNNGDSKTLDRIMIRIKVGLKGIMDMDNKQKIRDLIAVSIVFEYFFSSSFSFEKYNSLIFCYILLQNIQITICRN